MELSGRAERKDRAALVCYVDCWLTLTAFGAPLPWAEPGPLQRVLGRSPKLVASDRYAKCSVEMDADGDIQIRIATILHVLLQAMGE